jgi:hypothetical protein
MGVWDGLAFLLRHGLTGFDLRRQAVALVGLVCGAHPGIDGPVFL